MDAHELFRLSPHGADTFVGLGPRYPWGGLYGGQIVALAEGYLEKYARKVQIIEIPPAASKNPGVRKSR